MLLADLKRRGLDDLATGALHSAWAMQRILANLLLARRTANERLARETYRHRVTGIDVPLVGKDGKSRPDAARLPQVLAEPPRDLLPLRRLREGILRRQLREREREPRQGSRWSLLFPAADGPRPRLLRARPRAGSPRGGA